MKFLIVSFALAAVAQCAEYQQLYNKQAPYQGTVANSAILRQSAEQNEGGYAYSYETENGIAASETGSLKAAGPQGEPAIEAHGGYSYTGPDGVLYSVEYVAGPEGFQAKGAHLPVSPPIPELILRSLEYNAAHPQKEETEYYKPEPQKPYYPTGTTSKPFYSSARPTYQPQPTYQPTYQPNYQPYQGFPNYQQGFAQPRP